MYNPLTLRPEEGSSQLLHLHTHAIPRVVQFRFLNVRVAEANNAKLVPMAWRQLFKPACFLPNNLAMYIPTNTGLLRMSYACINSLKGCCLKQVSQKNLRIGH